MIMVEDLIEDFIRYNIPLQAIDKKIILSFLTQLRTGNSFTEKQGNLAVKIIKKYHKILTAHTGKNILTFCANPQFKYPFRVTSAVKKISIMNKNVEGFLGKVVKVEFPYDQVFIDLIKSKKFELGQALWNKTERAWLFSLCERNIKFLNYLIVTEGFQADDEFLQYSKQIIEIVSTLDNHVPMVVMDKSFPTYKNASEYVPSMSAIDIVSALFEARRRGINTWSEEIEIFIKNYQNSVTVDFLRSNSQDIFYVDSKIFEISSLEDIILNLKPLVVVIPGGSELEKTKMVFNFLKKIGINEKNISVLFRLSSESGKNFNNFVKQSDLNNPVNENTEIVFVSGKIPKPLIKSKKFFNAVINLGFENAHYTGKMFIDKHHNVIQYSEKPVQRNFLWQLLES